MEKLTSVLRAVKDYALIPYVVYCYCFRGR